MGHANHRFTNIIHVSAVAVACCLLLVFATSATTARVIRRSADDGSDQPHSNASTSTPVTIVIERAAAAAADQANHNINIATTTVRRRDEENAVGKTADTGTDGGRERQSSPAFVGDIAATTTGPVTSALSAGDKSALKAIRQVFNNAISRSICWIVFFFSFRSFNRTMTIMPLHFHVEHAPRTENRITIARASVIIINVAIRQSSRHRNQIGIIITFVCVCGVACL